MKHRIRTTLLYSIAITSLLQFSVLGLEPGGSAPSPVTPDAGPAMLQLGGRTAAIRKLDALSYIESQYTRLFRFDTFANPKLKELRERYKLDAVVAPGKDEFDRQILLLDWVHHQFKKFGRPSAETHGRAPNPQRD